MLGIVEARYKQFVRMVGADGSTAYARADRVPSLWLQFSPQAAAAAQQVQQQLPGSLPKRVQSMVALLSVRV
jgi:hypothetical protein